MGRNLNTSNRGILSDLASGNTSLVTVTGRDAFAVGDPVFLDYQLGEVVNRDLACSADALTAGGGVLAVVSPVQQNPTTMAGGFAQFSDGSFVVVNTIHSTVGDTTQRLSFLKYDKQGVFLQQATLSLSTVTPPNHIVLVTALSTGTHFAYAFHTNNNGTNFGIVDSNLRVVTSSFIASSTTAVLQAVSDGFLISATSGLYKFSMAGVLTTHATLTVTYTGEDNTDGADCKKNYASNNTGANGYAGRAGFFGISSGGYGIFLTTSSANLTYYRFNSDGTLRGSTSIATGLTNAQKIITAVGASGNILWANISNGGITWGIVADAGTTVKAAAAIASSDPVAQSANLHAITDANGDFLFSWSSGTGATLNYNYVSASAGTSKGGWPRSDAISTTSQGCRLYRVSTGIVSVTTTTGSLYTGQYSFFNNSGTVVKDKVGLYVGGNTGVAFTSTWAATVFNDAVYGFNALVGDFSFCLHRFDNAGTYYSSPTTGSGSSTTVPVVHASSIDIKAFVGGWIFRFRTSDMMPLGSFNQGFGTTAPAVDANRFLVAKFGQLYVTTHQSSQAYASTWTYTAGPWYMGTISSGEKTVLLGVAASDSVAGGPLHVQTKGSSPCTWTSVRQAFDQSAASPPGNAGAIVGSVMFLKGIAGT